MLYVYRILCVFAFYAVLTTRMSSSESTNTGGTPTERKEEETGTSDASNADETNNTSDPKKDAGNSSLQLEGKLALVTGGASGIGRSVSLVLAREGVTVIVADFNETGSDITIQMLNEVKQGRHKAIYTDVRNSTQVALLFECVALEFSNMSISIVVNSAGILHNATPVVNLTEATFDDVLNTNLKGTFLITQQAVRHMLSNNVTDGSIVNIASILGKGGFPGISAYAASKGGVVAFTKSVALETAKLGIRVNAILPGLTDTPMIAKYTTEQIKNRTKNFIPMGRMARPIEISETIVFMSSSKASYMTGATIDVAGGMYL